jgi:hypothetical protein
LLRGSVLSGNVPGTVAIAGVSIMIAVLLGSGSKVVGVLGDIAVAGTLAIPLSMGVAILKYRLFDIDRIISRTLAYAIVTGLLVGVYAGLVLLATQVLAVKSPVAVAASTLAVAALFTPVRRRVQRVVDRRFNRARYDAPPPGAAGCLRGGNAALVPARNHGQPTAFGTRVRLRHDPRLGVS